MQEAERIYAALGIAQKAGKAVSGAYALKSALCSGKVFFLIIATDVSENTAKELMGMADSYHVKYVRALDKVKLGWAVGKAQRAAVGITDRNCAKMFVR